MEPNMNSMKMNKEVLKNQNGQDIVLKKDAATQDMLLDNQNSDTNDFKVKWLTTTLNFIKDSNWHVLMYPEMPQEQMEFIETLITHKNMSSDIELKPLLASIREAMTIFKLKYDFTLKSTKKSNGSVQLIIAKEEKGQATEVQNCKNVKTLDSAWHAEGIKNCGSRIFRGSSVFETYSFVFMIFLKGYANDKIKKKKGSKERNESSVLAGGYKSKIIRQKLKIISDVPMKFILDSLHRIVEFLKDMFSVSIIFKDMNTKEWTFLMNVKSLLKNRLALMDQLSAQLNDLLKEIASQQNYDFTLSLNVDRFDKKKDKRSVTMLKTPKYDQQVVRREKSKWTRNPKILIQGGNEELMPSNSNLGDKLLTTLNSTAKEEDFKRPLSLDRQTLSSSMESLTVSISSRSDNRQVSIERRSASTSSSNVNFKSAGTLDQGVETCTAKKKKAKGKDRGRGKDKKLGPMKSKLIEGMSVPVESSKGLRMMLLMGWKGGALGARGDGITEPIMPDLQTVSGAGLGHKQKSRKEKVKKKGPRAHSGESIKIEAKRPKRPVTNTGVLDPVTKTRLEILQGILELVESFDERMQYNFDREPNSREINFIEPAIVHFNARKVPDDFHVEAEQLMVEDITDAMIGNRDVLLHAKISPDKREIEITKTCDNITFDEPIYNDRFIRCNQDVHENYPAMSVMSDYCDEVTSQLSIDKFMATMEPMGSYGVRSKRQYRFKAFKMMMLGEILDFLEAGEINRIIYLETEILNNDVKTIKKCIEMINVGGKDNLASAPEASILDRILSKMGDCCLTLDYNENQQLMRLTKVFPKKPLGYTATCTPLPANSVPVKHGTYSKHDKNSQSEMEASVNISENQEKRSLLPELSKQDLIEDHNKKNENILSNVEIHIDKNGQISNDLDNNLNDQLLPNVESNRNDEVAFDENEELPENSRILLKDIENLEKSILAAHMKKTDREAKNNHMKKTGIYKNIGITCCDSNVEMDLEVVNRVQKILSDAIDECKNALPLLQYHGTIGNQIVYSCFSEESYLWIKEVLRDRYTVTNVSINPKDTYRLRMQLNRYNGDVQNVLDKIFLYNPDLDLGTWMIGRETVNDNFTLIDIEVNGDSLEYINRCNFALFAGVDKVHFYMK